jgi:hypothetical protein
MPDEWRREIFVPCGTLNGSLRFYDELANLAREDPSRARDLAETAVRSVDWAAFAGDPTGDAPLPAMRHPAPAAAIALSRSRRPGNRRGPGRGPDGPGRRIELLIAAGRTREALLAAQSWIETSPRGPAEPWFGLSARLASVAGGRLPAWLEALEAEREVAGGRLEEAEKRLARAAEAVSAPEDERRRAKLRLAEVCALRGRMKEAGRAAAAWRGAFADAPAEEIVRALLLAAKMRTARASTRPPLSCSIGPTASRRAFRRPTVSKPRSSAPLSIRTRDGFAKRRRPMNNGVPPFSRPATIS